MPPSESSGTAERRPPVAEDFPRTGPFSLAAPAPRFAARAVDLALVLAPAAIVVAFTARTVGGQVRLDIPAWLGPSLLALGVTYEWLSVLAAQRTVGKALFGLRLVRYVDGGRPTTAQALVRALLPWSVLALPLGPFAVALFLCVYGTGIAGSLHRGWPDLAGGTIELSTR